LFKALGWDTENPAEFSAEEQISRGFVDFGFYLNSVPAFYLETKKAAEQIDKPQHMKQAINYSYLKGVTWAVLSDFEGVMVFNAEWEETDPVKTRFLDLHWEQYAGSDFERLWLLSKPSFQAREIDRVAESFGRKARKEPVTETLFKQLTVWRRELFEQMRTYGTKIWATDPRAVDNAVQKFLDRLIFLRTVEDRGVEGSHLKEVTRQTKRDNLFPSLLKLFREMDAVYNSNLFAEGELDYMEVHDPDLLKEIVDGLYRAPGGFVTYDFNAITADILGAVYEQYLGFKALDPEGKTALDPRKQEKRKKQGIYYTPQFVVRYIGRQTLGKLLNPDSDSNKGLNKGLKPLVQSGGSRLPTAEEVHKLRILDPACGSGSFLIEAFDVLDRWLAQNGTDEDKNFPRRRRLRILQENLYGVDLDDQAVEVTRLNLMLRAALERGKLPPLTHIQHGNSLIDDPDVAGDTAFKWEERFPEVFAGHNRPLWFVTFVTHNSRVSERMVTYGIQSGEPLVFSPEEQILIAEKIAEACQKYNIAVVAWNVLPDHIHMVIAAEDENTLNEYVRKIKGYSSYAFRRAMAEHDGLSESGVESMANKRLNKGLKPLVHGQNSQNALDDEAERRRPTWAQKFNKWYITDQKALYEIIEYVRSNHEKHVDRWGEELAQTWEIGLPNKGLKPLVQIIRAICVPPEEAAHVSGGFDVVIGNPPYGAELNERALQSLREIFGKDAGTHDTYELFLLKGAQLLNKDSRMGMIIPSSWLTGESYLSSRAALVSRLSPTVAYAMPFDVFEGAYIDTAIVGFFSNNSNAENCLIHYFPKKEKLREVPEGIGVSVPTAAIRSDAQHLFSIMLSKEYGAIIEKLKSCAIKYGDWFIIQRGVQPYSRSKHSEPDIQARFLHSDTRASDAHLPELQGDELSRYWINPIRKSYLEYSDRIASSRPIRTFQGERIVLRRLLTRQFRLQASYTSETMITTDNVLNLVPKDEGINVLYALGVLNSKITS